MCVFQSLIDDHEYHILDGYAEAFREAAEIAYDEETTSKWFRFAGAAVNTHVDIYNILEYHKQHTDSGNKRRRKRRFLQSKINLSVIWAIGVRKCLGCKLCSVPEFLLSQIILYTNSIIQSNITILTIGMVHICLTFPFS